MRVFGRARESTWLDANRRHTTVLGHRVAHLETGAGEPIVFLHAGIGAGAAWTRVLPHLADTGRCVAVDLVGFGESDRLYPAAWIDYSLRAQQRIFDSFMEISVGEEPVILVLSGLASVLGFKWARHHRKQVRGICHMESVYRTFNWIDFEAPARDTLRTARGRTGESYVLDTDEYFEQALAVELSGRPGPEAREHYLRLFGVNRQQRLATLALIRELPINGRPNHAHEVVEDYAEWLAASSMPKLFIAGEPGYLFEGQLRAGAARLPNQRVVSVRGAHVLPIDSPAGLARFIRSWIRTDLPA